MELEVNFNFRRIVPAEMKNGTYWIRGITW